jgi:hypothetical protein
METNKPILLQKHKINEVVDATIHAITEGNIDPIVAHINICRLEQAIKLIKENQHVKLITLDELAKYGKKHEFGDVTLEEVEAGVKYDYGLCGDSVLSSLEHELFEISAKIKARQQFLKCLPISGCADPTTGEVIYPPTKSSKTTIKTTFKRY